MNTSSFVSVQDGLRIVTFEWPATTGEVRGVVQIAHGLAEHSARYARLAAALNAVGYHVGSTDHRGHGASIAGTPGDFGAVGFSGLWHDVVQYGGLLRNAHADLPVYLLAHSMGSFAAQELLPEYSTRYDGVILSGSTAIDVMAARMAAGPAGDLSVFNSAFENRTGYEWLSRDEAEVDAYVADPLCGFTLPAETTPALFADGARLSDPAELARIRSDLPILIISGSDDPLSGGGQLPRLLAQRYTDAGVADVTVVVYPGARHEVFNETNRDEVTTGVVSWLQAH
ncbi:MAG: alpha/beta fold hydrolase [Propionibacterium sp.]|nr:alpha/beta fold hydrolase [Propionibacterium sp.]